MNLLGKLKTWARKAASTLTLSPQERLWLEVFGGRLTKSGQTVTLEQALRCSAVFGCIRVLADGVAQVPLKLFRESADGKRKEPARGHPLYDVLSVRPNPWQTSVEYRETVMMHAVLCRAHYSFINRIGNRIVELIPLVPANVTVIRALDGTRTYRVRNKAGEEKDYPQETIWHVPGPSWDGVNGLDVLDLAREAIGLGLATEEHHASMHAVGAQPPGLISVEGKLTPEQYKALRNWLDTEHAGAANAGKTMILDNGAKYMSMAMTGLDAEHLATRQYQIAEVCRFMRVMPIMVGVSDKVATYASAEQMFLSHVVHTLTPWYVRLEQSISVWLLTKDDRNKGIYPKFIAAGLLRGALKDTADYLVKMTGGGIMTRNEARQVIDLDWLEGLDEPLTPLNMTTDPGNPDNTPAK